MPVKVRRLAKRFGSAELAEDLVQGAYVRLLEIRTRHAIDDPAAYLARTAGNLRMDMYRRDRWVDGRAPVELLCRDMADQRPLQDEVLWARVRLENVQRALDRLTPRTREIFLMHRLDGMRYREIARHLGISESAVEKHIAKALLLLTGGTERP